MSWKHVALVALAVVLVLGCGISHVCGANSATLDRVSYIALAIVSFAGGNAGQPIHKPAPPPPPAPAKEAERTT